MYEIEKLKMNWRDEMKIDWEVNYPTGLVRYIDYFRSKYFQYYTFDKVVHNYIDRYCNSNGKRILSLGSGTGRHEVELAKLGYNVIGLERNEESVKISKNYISECNADVEIYTCDFLDERQVDNVMQKIGTVDVVVLLFIPISIRSYECAIQNFRKWIKHGGLYIADFFSYKEGFSDSTLKIESNVEVADSNDQDDYVVRMNYYEYLNGICNWDAIYLYYDDQGSLCMRKDHDILEIIPEEESKFHLNLPEKEFEILPNHKVIECNEYIAPPHLYEYLIGRRKK